MAEETNQPDTPASKSSRPGRPRRIDLQAVGSSATNKPNLPPTIPPVARTRSTNQANNSNNTSGLPPKISPNRPPVVRSTARRTQHQPAAVLPKRPPVDPLFKEPDINNPHTPRTSKMLERSENKTRRPWTLKRAIRLGGVAVIVLLVLSLLWGGYLIHRVNSQIKRLDILTSGGQNSGTTFLIAGSDERTNDGIWDPETEGHRADSIMILHIPASGTPSLISIPRDTAVELNGDMHKINATMNLDNGRGLVQAVQNLSGMHVDHYLQIGMGGVKELVDAVGGVELCYENNVDDEDSGMKWTAGCHKVDGTQALAFSRMRKSDPLGDIGRGLRQRQVVRAVAKQAVSFKSFLPWNTLTLVDAGSHTIQADSGTGVLALYRALKAMQTASEKGTTGAPPISDFDYRPGGIGSAVELSPEESPAFWEKVKYGTVKPEDFHQFK